MSKLTTKARKAIPKKDFAGPNETYPVENVSHAIDAKARAAQAVKAGRMSESEKARIDADANKVIRKHSHDHTQD